MQVDKNVCRKEQGKAEEGNSCLQTPGTCESCPNWGKTHEPGYVLAVTLYVYRWNRMGRKGQLCRVLKRGKRNSCLVEFIDGYQAVTSRNAIMRYRGK